MSYVLAILVIVMGVIVHKIYTSCVDSNSLQLQKCVYRMVLVHHDWWDYCWPGWKCTGITVRFFTCFRK